MAFFFYLSFAYGTERVEGEGMRMRMEMEMEGRAGGGGFEALKRVEGSRREGVSKGENQKGVFILSGGVVVG